MSKLNTGIEQGAVDQIVQKLSELLASNYTLYLKTQNFHWNVRGPFFQQLHTMFELQYDELAIANDQIAERIRALGVLAPGSAAKFAKLSFIEESEEDVKAEKMVKILLEDNELLTQKIRELLVIAGDAGDDATGDLLGPRMSSHEKTSWMLRAFLEG